ncbi:unnamed protein product [Dovyalis caffra]|uniref:Uncharacterized protein n=1 Tax=Dovyalis caffra TaxID=77055 RepID=A0AAV1RLA1_9ROSI|nr:unnamed protein product [Dovyalis caffra]
MAAEYLQLVPQALHRRAVFGIEGLEGSLSGMPMAEMVKLLLTLGFHEDRQQCATDLDPKIARLTEVGVEVITIATGFAARLFLIDA